MGYVQGFLCDEILRTKVSYISREGVISIPELLLELLHSLWVECDVWVGRLDEGRNGTTC